MNLILDTHNTYRAICCGICRDAVWSKRINSDKHAIVFCQYCLAGAVIDYKAVNRAHLLGADFFGFECFVLIDKEFHEGATLNSTGSRTHYNPKTGALKVYRIETAEPTGVSVAHYRIPYVRTSF